MLTADGVQGVHDLGAFSVISQNVLFLPYIFVPASSRKGLWYRNRNPKGLVSLLSSSVTSGISSTFYFYIFRGQGGGAGLVA